MLKRYLLNEVLYLYLKNHAYLKFEHPRILLLVSFALIGIIYYSRPKNKVVKIPETQITGQMIKSHKIFSIVPKSVEAS